MGPEDSTFKIDVPIEVWQKADAEPGRERRIGGIISTEHKDRQEETVLQRGLDFADFLSSGWLNDNHAREAKGILGYPEKIEPTVVDGKAATRMEGYLLKTKAADDIWELAQALKGTDRRLGFSIEGKVERRTGQDGKVIAKARVTNVAITHCPVNTKTGMDVLVKSLMAGSSINGGPPAPGSGFALRTESLDRLPKKKKKKKRWLTKSEAIAIINARYPGISGRSAERIWRFARCTRRTEHGS